MGQLDLFAWPKLRESARWASRSGRFSVVVLVSLAPHPFGLGEELRAGGFSLMGKQFYRGGLALRLRGSESAIASVLSTIPGPRSQGSNTEGNDLLW